MLNDEKFKKSYEDRSKDSFGVTLVGFYGDDKPAGLLQLVHDINRRVSDALKGYPDLFRPYGDRQVHATLCGMEGYRRGDHEIVTKNMQEKTGAGPVCPAFDVEAFLQSFSVASWPVDFQFGGYQVNDVNPYDKPRRPWERTFEIREDGLAVMMGWPSCGEKGPFAPLLIERRRSFESSGLVHKYHVKPGSQDNDLFLVVGSLDYPSWKRQSDAEKQSITAKLSDLQDEVRTFMAGGGTRIELSRRDIWVVKYKRTTLEEVEFPRRIDEVTADEIRALYQTL